MIDCVFISDLHLHPNDAAITERFHKFVFWAKKNVRSVYILGDFFHVWPGDDAFDAWSLSVVACLAELALHGVAVYFMSGNRDFLVGDEFAKRAKLTMLTEPAVMTFGDDSVLLVHGDRFCTKDTGHQRLRFVTRNRWFPNLFLRLSLKKRLSLVTSIRQRSQANRHKPAVDMGVVPETLLAYMHTHKARVVIHGHTHEPGLTLHHKAGYSYSQYVLSDWDDNPTLLCYDKTKGFYFILFSGEKYE